MSETETEELARVRRTLTFVRQQRDTSWEELQRQDDALAAARAEVAALRSAVEAKVGEWECRADAASAAASARVGLSDEGQLRAHAQTMRSRADDLRSLLPSVGPSGEAESGEACGSCGHRLPHNQQFGCMTEVGDAGSGSVADAVFCKCTAPAPVSSGGQADGEGELPLATIRRASQAFLEAEHDYMGQDLAPLDGPMRAALAAARPVLSREALRERLDGHWLEDDTCICGWSADPQSVFSHRTQWRDHLADILAGGEQR